MSVVIVTRPCPFCGRSSEVTLTDEEAAAYRDRDHVQTALPHWSDDQRELLISGSHPACWDAAFGDED